MDLMAIGAASIERGGILKGARAAEVIMSWAIAEQKLGHQLGGGELSAAIREHAEFWRQTERTSWNELRRFHEVWPKSEEPSPARLAGQALAASSSHAQAAA